MAGELHDDLREGRVDSVFVLRVMGKSSANRGSLGRTYLQIADEIERLRSALDGLVKVIDAHNQYVLTGRRTAFFEHENYEGALDVAKALLGSVCEAAPEEPGNG